MKAAVLLAGCLALGATEVAAQATQTDPLEFYRGYLAVLAKAKSLDELVPYYPKELGDNLRRMPKEMQANYIKMNARALSDLKVTQQTASPDKVELQLSAKTAAGKATNGMATLVKQGGSWKVGDEQWAAPLP